jgi:glucose/arabinose dehydrogenase
MYNALCLFLFSISLSFAGWANVVHHDTVQSENIQIEQITSGHGVIWGITFLGSDHILFTTRNGKLGLLSLKSGLVQYLRNAPEVLAEGQGGLLDVAVRPNYKSGDWIYFTYVKNKKGKGVTTLAKAKISADKTKLISWQDMFISDSATSTSRHFGSRIAFDGKGHVYFTIGDRGVRPSAQNLMNHNGTVIRLNLDGSVPRDNPFVGKGNALPEIWSYGHRNPQGIVYDEKADHLWVIEHGPRGGDEINLVLKGRNYGWPEISYGKEYWGPMNVADATHKEGMEQPYKVYTPSIAPSSLMLYQGDVFPRWKGSLFAGALKLRHLNRISVNVDGKLTTEERLLEDLDERIRSVIQGPDGLVYFSTDSGKVYRITNLSD